MGSDEYRSLDDVDEDEYRTLSFPAGGPPDDGPIVAPPGSLVGDEDGDGSGSSVGR